MKGYLYKRGKIWWVRWRVGAAVYAASTGKESKRDAEKERERLIEPWTLREAALREAALVARVVKAREVVEAANALKAGRLGLDEVAVPVRSARGGALASRSAAEREGDWRLFLDWLGEHYPRAKTVGDLKPSMGKEYAEELGRTLTQARVRARLGVVRSVLAGVGAAGGWENVELGAGREAPGGGRRAFTKDEVARLLAGTEGEERALLATLYWTGLRLGDAATLRRSNRKKDADGRRRLAVHTSKGKKDVVLVESDALSPILDEAEKRGSEWLFPAAAELAGGKRRAMLSTRLNATIARVLGVERVKREKGRRGVSEVCVHSFRHTLATLCADSGVPIEDVRQYLGHSSAVVTRIYTHRDAAKMGEKVNAALSLPSVEGAGGVGG